jgi:hypothetical protein
MRTQVTITCSEPHCDRVAERAAVVDVGAFGGRQYMPAEWIVLPSARSKGQPSVEAFCSWSCLESYARAMSNNYDPIDPPVSPTLTVPG